MVLAYITCKDKKEAVKISMHLLRKRLIACSNMFPISSLYWWKNKIASGKEFVIIAKTTEKNFKTIEKEVKKTHSYEIPAILKIKADANDDYMAWVMKETK